MADESRIARAEKETGRIEAFSDGVFAVAITLLAFDILKIPQPPAGQPFSAEGLAAALGHQWPIYASFLISFATILIMWLNHHSIFQLVQKTDPVFMFANGFLLMLVTRVPLPTALLGEYLIEAAAVYAGLFVVISLAFVLLWWAAAIRRPLLRPDVPPAQVRRRTIANLIGVPAYVLALVCAFWAPILSVAICGVLWVFWAFTSARL